MADSIKLISMNVNSLSTLAKRGKVMAKLSKERAQIILMQETHLSQLEHEKLKVWP